MKYGTFFIDILQFYEELRLPFKCESLAWSELYSKCLWPAILWKDEFSCATDLHLNARKTKSVVKWHRSGDFSLLTYNIRDISLITYYLLLYLEKVSTCPWHRVRSFVCCVASPAKYSWLFLCKDQKSLIKFAFKNSFLDRLAQKSLSHQSEGKSA